MRKAFHLTAAGLALCILLTAFSGCGEKDAGSSGTSTAGAELPIVQEPITLTWWYPLAPDAGSDISTWADCPAIQELESRTNIKLNFEIPTGDAAQQYTYKVASGTLPDIMTHRWFGYGNGPDDAVNDKVYIDLTGYLDEGKLPNYKSMLEATGARKSITSAGGLVTWFANLRVPGLDRQPPYVGPIVRKDWLDKLGLDEPVTIADWYAMLKAFKTQLNVKMPLVTRESGYDWTYTFMNAYGVSDGFNVENGKVFYGPYDDRMLSYLTEMNKWYKEGLMVCEEVDEKAYSDDSAGAWNHGFYLLDSWKEAARDPNYNAIGVDYPVLQAGDVLNITARDDAASTYGSGTFITTANKYPLETAKMFDYLYSEAGQLLQMYGVEGKTYEVKDGKPAFTDYMVNNPAKSFLTQLKSNTFSWFVNDWRIEQQGFSEKEQKTLTVKWSKVKDANVLPDLSFVGTTEEINEFNRQDPQISPYVKSMLTKFIKGEEPLTNWQAFKDQLKTLGIERQIQIMQSKYDTFMSSK